MYCSATKKASSFSSRHLQSRAKSVILIKLHWKRRHHMVRLFDLEMYRSGRNENDSKSFCPEMGTWVRIPPSPPPDWVWTQFAFQALFLSKWVARVSANRNWPSSPPDWVWMRFAFQALFYRNEKLTFQPIETDHPSYQTESGRNSRSRLFFYRNERLAFQSIETDQISHQTESGRSSRSRLFFYRNE